MAVVEVKTLGELLEFTNGREASFDEAGEFPVYGSNGIIGRSNSYNHENAIIIGRVGAYCGSLAFSMTPFWATDNTIVAYPREYKDDARFFYYLLQSIDLNRLAGGSAQPLLVQSVLKKVSTVVLSNRTSRLAVASVLSAYDDLIENNRRRIQIYEEIARTIYREWFMHFRFPGYETVKMVDSELGKIPEGWSIKAASEAMYIDPPIAVPKTGMKKYIGMGSLVPNSMCVAHIEHKETRIGSKFQNGDTVFPQINPSLQNGKTAYVMFLDEGEVGLGTGEFIVLRSKTLCPEYVYLLARTYGFRENAIKTMIGTSGRQRVRKECFDSFLIANPDDETLGRFRLLVSPMFNLAYCLKRINDTCSEMRNLLLPKLVSGRIDVSKPDIHVPKKTSHTSKYKEQSTLDQWTDGDDQDADVG